MMRIVIENIFFFLLPTMSYIAWVAFQRNDWPGMGAVLREAPLMILFVLGAALMLTTLIAFSSTSGSRPGEGYEPAIFKDGKVTPGRTTKPTQ